MHPAVRTLDHIDVVDRIFRAHLLGEKYLTDVTADSLAQDVSFHFTDGDAGRMTREEMPLHVITHGAYHRGNVGQILKSVLIAPPPDLYTKFLRVNEPSLRRV